MTPEDAKKLRQATIRSAGDGALHPDQCPKLWIAGIEWAVPPRCGVVSPVFGDGDEVTISAAEAESWPDAQRLIELAEIRDTETCPECGQATKSNIVAEIGGASEFLSVAFSLAGRLLRRQYRLDANQLTALLAFPSDKLPGWIGDLLGWCA